MIEIVFSESACGSLKVAQHYGSGKYFGCTGVILSHSDGKKPTKAEIEIAQHEAEERLRAAWENATPLGGNTADIFGFNLALSLGSIAREHFITNRKVVLERQFSIYPNEEGIKATKEILKKSTNNLEVIHERLAKGEPLCIWYSNQPDDMCGLYWFMFKLICWEMGDAQVFCVKLPEWEICGENIIQKSGWGEVAPEEWHRYVGLKKAVPPNLIKSYASSWQKLQRENAPLRAVLNGQLVSLSENIYDDFILREIEMENEEFLEANVIGRVLGKNQLGIGDAFIALRIEDMIKDGKLKIISAITDDMPVYHRMLKKS